MGHNFSHLFAKIQSEGRITPETLPKIQKMWQTYDSDGSGVLEKNEAVEFFSDLYDFLNARDDRENIIGSKEQVVSLWYNHFDSKSDGALNWNEFVIALSGILLHTHSSVKIEAQINAEFETKEEEQEQLDPFWAKVHELAKAKQEEGATK